jgi:hypothetical protein
VDLVSDILVGLDLGQRRDHSAIAVVERERTGWMYSGPRTLCIRYLQRIPLGTSYTKVVERVGEVVRRPQLAGRCRVVVDATGVGGPVVDLLKSARLDCPLTAVTITSGDRAHNTGDRWHVPKRDLLTNLLVLLEARELKIPKGLADAGTLVRELGEMEMKQSGPGKVQMGAEGSGEHDDLVIAVALACWRAALKEIGFGTRRLPGI